MIPRRRVGTAPAGLLLILAHDAPAARRAHPQKVRRPAHHQQIHLAEGGSGIHHRPAVHRRARCRGQQALRDRLGYLPGAAEQALIHHGGSHHGSLHFREPSPWEQEENKQSYPLARVLRAMTTCHPGTGCGLPRRDSAGCAAVSCRPPGQKRRQMGTGRHR